MEKIIKYLLLVLLITQTSKSYCQISAVSGVSGSIIRGSDILNLYITNSNTVTTQVNLSINFIIKGNANKILSYSINNLSLEVGINRLKNINQMGNYVFSNQLVTLNDMVMPGDYQHCIVITSYPTNEPLYFNCFDFSMVPLTPPILILPNNYDTVSSLNPNLTWLPVSPSNKRDILYTIKVVEILMNQSPIDAIQRNYGILQKDNIINTTLLYPTTALKLEYFKQYAWQVTAYNKSGQYIGASEVWSFYTKKESSPTNVKYDLPVSYHKPKEIKDASVVGVINVLHLEYGTKTDSLDHAEIMIYDLNDRLITAIDKKDIKRVYDNKYDIDLIKQGLNKNSTYTVQITYQKAKSFITFKYQELQ